VVSIEMIEAVGEAYWPTYFAAVRDRLRPGGRMGMQAILIDDSRFARYRRGADFIQRHVFPGGMLPCQSALKAVCDQAGLAWRGDRSYGEHYAQTLRLWRDRFLETWPTIRTLGFDERFRRIWTFYLAYCEAGFDERTIDLRQIVLARE
jgi:cyclopropane-fatty-acyl-phospholipid synthase